jgi:hypothetical protein
MLQFPDVIKLNSDIRPSFYDIILQRCDFVALFYDIIKSLPDIGNLQSFIGMLKSNTGKPFSC